MLPNHALLLPVPQHLGLLTVTGEGVHVHASQGTLTEAQQQRLIEHLLAAERLPLTSPQEEDRSLLTLLTVNVYESILEDEPNADNLHEVHQALAEGYSAARYAYAWTGAPQEPFCIETVAYRTGPTWRNLWAQALDEAHLADRTQEELDRVRVQLATAPLELYPEPLVCADIFAWGLDQGAPLPLPSSMGPVFVTTTGQLKQEVSTSGAISLPLLTSAYWIETEFPASVQRALHKQRQPVAHLAHHLEDHPRALIELPFPDQTAFVRCLTTVLSMRQSKVVSCGVLSQAWQPLDVQGQPLAPPTLWESAQAPGMREAAAQAYEDVTGWLARQPARLPTARTFLDTPVLDLRPQLVRQHEAPLTLEGRLNQYAQDLRQRYPHAYRQMPDLHQRRPHPPETFVPLADLAAVVAQTHDLLDPLVQADLLSLMTVGTWRVTRGVYRLDETVLDALWNETAPPDELPLEQLRYLPEWSVYVPLPGRVTAEGWPIHGVFAMFTPEQVLLTVDLTSGSLAHESIVIGTKSLAEAVQQDAQDTPAGMRVGHAGFLGNVLNVLLYLCTVDVDLPSRPVRPTRLGRKRGGGLAQQVTTWEVGVRLGAALRKAQSEGRADPDSAYPRGTAVRPHIRRAHFHHFRTGALALGEARPLRLRWLPPIPVKVEWGEGDLPVVVRPVQA